MTISSPITIAYGDGIGPEIMEATLSILREADAKLEIETIEIGERIYNMGGHEGILPSAWDGLRRTKLLLKAPVGLPKNEHYNAVDAVLCQTLGLHKVISYPYGYAISNLAADMSAAGYAGEDFALFEPNHGNMPEIAGKNKANPSGMIHAAVLMLTHIGQPQVAQVIHNAWLKTMEDGIHTRDIYKWGESQEKVGTQVFADAVIERL